MYLSPSYIHSGEELSKLIQIGQTVESIVLDFKVEITISNLSSKKKKEVAEEFALDICQFANTWGGVLAIGVKEELDESRGRKVATGFVDTVDFEDLSQFINNNVLPLIHPSSLQFEIVPVTTKNGHNLVIINIFPLTSGLSCVFANQPPYPAKYPYRTNYGKKYFHPSEIEKRMSDVNRSIPIKLHEISFKTKTVTLFPKIIKEEIKKTDTWDSKGVNIVFKDISNYAYTLNINGVDINIPFSLTKDVWLTEKNTMGILLGIQVSLSPDRKSINLGL